MTATTRQLVYVQKPSPVEHVFMENPLKRAFECRYCGATVTYEAMRDARHGPISSGDICWGRDEAIRIKRAEEFDGWLEFFGPMALQIEKRE